MWLSHCIKNTITVADVICFGTYRIINIWKERNGAFPLLITDYKTDKRSDLQMHKCLLNNEADHAGSAQELINLVRMIPCDFSPQGGHELELLLRYNRLQGGLIRRKLECNLRVLSFCLIFGNEVWAAFITGSKQEELCSIIFKSGIPRYWEEIKT